MRKKSVVIGLLLLMMAGAVLGNIGPTITDFKVVPNISTNYTSSITVSANVFGVANVGIDVDSVEFGIVDSSNLAGNNVSILVFNRNFSRAEGLYRASSYAKYADIGNGTLSDNASVYRASDIPGYLLVRGTFKDNSTSNEIQALLWFNQTTLGLSKVADGGNLLNIEEGKSTFRAKVFKYNESGNMNPEYTSEKVFALYNITGSLSNNNPRLILKNMPNGRYTVYAAAYGNDSNYTIKTVGMYVANYDTDSNGSINKAEAVQAVVDYFNGVITKQIAIAVVVAYFSSG